MPTNHPDQNVPSTPETWSVVHPLTAADAGVVSALRTAVAPMKGKMQGTAARQPYAQIMGRVPSAPDVTYEADTVGGIPGWWCRPAGVRSSGVILHFHGGWYVWGSALAHRFLVGHIAARAGAAAFVADYRLAPEHPFPAAVLDAQACYRGLVERGLRQIAIVGDSAGGGLGLALLSLLSGQPGPDAVLPVGAVALSPVTDLAQTGQSWDSRAEADAYFTRSQAAGLLHAYLGDHDPKDPLASPLHGNLAGLPPIRIHVGEDELLLDDSRRYAERAAAAGVDARVDVWQGMQHGFPGSVGKLAAADGVLDEIGAFLAGQLADAAH